jgi:hypothetical protein
VLAPAVATFLNEALRLIRIFIGVSYSVGGNVENAYTQFPPDLSLAEIRD